MKRYIATIKGKKYWYVQDTIFIAKGVKKLTSNSLGRVDRATEQSLLSGEQRAREAMIKRETEERTTYWHNRIHESKAFPRIELERMENERSRLYRAKKDLGQFGNAALETAFLVDFIYNSNRLEGSRLPKDEVKRLVQEEGGKNNEVTNTLAAKSFLQTKFQFKVKSLVRMHAILLAHEPTKQGLRKTEIMVGNDRSLCPVENIITKLNGLFSWYEENKHKMYPPELAFRFYYQFERIHPFMDGNGRMGRLLMNEILKEAKYHPIIIWNKRRRAHFSAFERGGEGEQATFLMFMIDEFHKTYETYLNKTRIAVDYEKMVDLFMTPSEE